MNFLSNRPSKDFNFKLSGFIKLDDKQLITSKYLFLM